MDADAARWSTGGDWAIDEQIDSALLRVRRDEETRWFAVVDSDAVGEAESTVWPSVRGASVDGRAGLLVPRCEGGLLEDALRLRGGMSAALALGVLDEVLEVLETAPAAPCGGSRAAIRSFAVERGGGVVLVPGRFRDGATRSDAAELGELLHLALTGATWEETGLPVSETAPEAPAAVSGLVTDLLEGSVLTGGATVPAAIADLRARIGRLGPSRERGFLPAEPGVLEDDAPTGTLSPELVEALRTSPTRSARTSESHQVGSRLPGARVPDRPPQGRRSSRRRRSSEGHRSSRVPTANGDEARPRRDRRRAERGRRHGRLATGILVLCAAAVAVGAVLMGTGAGSHAGDAEARHASSQPTPTTPLTPTNPADPTPTPPQPPMQPSMPSPSSAAPSEIGTHAAGPLDAAVALTRARAEAFANGDADALAAVTVPGSPAAEADAQRTLGECAECADALSLSDVGFAVDHESRGDESRGPGAEQDFEEGQPPADGQRAHVRATMRSTGTAPVPVVLVLEWSDDQWRVHDVRSS